MRYADLRVSDHDREQVVEHVKGAYEQGRFDKEEFDDRLHRAMTARTHADLTPIMYELYGTPAGPVMPAPGPRPGGVAGPLRSSDRAGAGMAHLLSAAGLFVVGPLIMLLTGGRTSPFIRRHAVEALNFHLTLLGGSVLLTFTVVGVILIPVIWIVAFVLSVVAGVAALGGDGYRYPFTIRPVK
ncbi:hypothetical protein Misp01_83440 [Microtetraspora sp. NBRC 13810]|nr:hypothetical protein Misp01_83440 [Microtetraspora sp. NBRC 13810]